MKWIHQNNLNHESNPNLCIKSPILKALAPVVCCYWLAPTVAKVLEAESWSQYKKLHTAGSAASPAGVVSQRWEADAEAQVAVSLLASTTSFQGRGKKEGRGGSGMGWREGGPRGGLGLGREMAADSAVISYVPSQAGRYYLRTHRIRPWIATLQYTCLLTSLELIGMQSWWLGAGWPWVQIPSHSRTSYSLFHLRSWGCPACSVGYCIRFVDVKW